MLADGVSFDAIFAANDLEARGAMDVLARADLRIPEDVALVGFDDAAGSDALQPPLRRCGSRPFSSAGMR